MAEVIQTILVPAIVAGAMGLAKGAWWLAHYVKMR